MMSLISKIIKQSKKKRCQIGAIGLLSCICMSAGAPAYSETAEYVTEEAQYEKLYENEKIAADTGEKPEGETESETDTEGKKESETDTEGKKESGTDTEGKKESETDTEGETEIGTDTEKRSEKETDTDKKEESETKRAGESEGETDRADEPESESDAETESESEIDSRQVIHISNITAEEREYDGTDYIAVAWEIDDPSFEREQIRCEAHLDGCDAGERRVLLQFLLPEELENSYRLEEPDEEVYAVVWPRKLTIILPDGWKYYHEDAVIGNIHLEGEVQVTGFLTDETGADLVPDGFELPQVSVDPDVLRKNSAVYRDGKRNRLEKALMAARDEAGEIIGSCGSDNYVFDEENISGGTVTIHKAVAIRGQDYEIRGGDGCWEDGRGVWWHRSGSSITVSAMKGSGYNEAAQKTDGSFVLKNIRKGELMAESLPIPVQTNTDDSSPVFSFETFGGEEKNGMYWGKDAVWIQLGRVNDSESGMAETHYEIYRDDKAVETGSFAEGKSIELAEEGLYEVIAYASDHVGNVTRIDRGSICIDHTAPVIAISGIEGGDSMNTKPRIRIAVSDQYPDTDSISAKIRGKYGNSRYTGKKTIRSGEVEIRFPAFGKAEDDSYTLQITGMDLAGNRVWQEVSFSLNQKGSVYRLGEDTQNQLGQYYHKEAFDIVFIETNRGQIRQSKVLVICDGIPEIYDTGSGLQIRKDTVHRGMIEYHYTLPASCITKEGEYEVILLSDDDAGNSSDSVSQHIAVRFALDHTVPMLRSLSLKSGQIIRKEETVMDFAAEDDLALDQVYVLVDGEIRMEARGDLFAGAGGIVRCPIGKKDGWQAVTLIAKDAAGNIAGRNYMFYIAGEPTAYSVSWPWGSWIWIKIFVMIRKQLGQIIMAMI